MAAGDILCNILQSCDQISVAHPKKFLAIKLHANPAVIKINISRKSFKN